MGAESSQGINMSLLKRNSPRKTRAKKYQDRVGETISPTLSPAQKIITEIEPDITEKLLEEYSYKTETQEESQEPEQLNRALEPIPETKELLKSKTLQNSNELIKSNFSFFDLSDLSYMCEERIYKILYGPIEIKVYKEILLKRKFIQNKLEIYAEYAKEIEIGSFKDKLYYYKGEILLPEELIDVSGFLRQFLEIKQAHILYDTGEILLIDLEYCKFWYNKIQRWFEPINQPLDRPEILSEEVCLDCNLSCTFRRRQQMDNTN